MSELTHVWNSAKAAVSAVEYRIVNNTITVMLLGRKTMTNLDSVLKSKDISLPIKVHLVKAMVFPVVMHECESWTIERTGHQRVDTFELWCCRRLLRVLWIAKRSN